jgi:arginyl-tRNA synthetase
MNAYQDPFLAEVKKHVTSGLNELRDSHPAKPEIAAAQLLSNMTSPPKFELGQAALPCHSLAKAFRSSPVKIAEQLAGLMQKQPLKLIAKIDVVNGYLNFHANLIEYGKLLLNSIQSKKYFEQSLLELVEKEKILVEYSQPNTHKALHVGHLRNMVYGDAVCNLLDYAGHDVVRCTYPGDMGTHIAKSLWYIQNKKDSQIPDKNQADWLGEIYAESDDYVKSVAGTPDEAKVKTEIGAVLKQLQDQKGSAYDLYLQTREYSLQQMRDIYEWLGLKFDIWFFESECDEPSRELVLKKFKDGFFVKSEGAIGIDLNQYNLGFALYLKSDGNGLYLTKDLELIRRKFADEHVTRSIVVVDARQRLHFQQLFKTAELMGYPQAAKSLHLSYETVTTADGTPCSSRNLNGIQLSELRHTMEQKVINDYLKSYQGDWSDEEIQETARIIALGALKYGFLKVDSNVVIKFVMEDWLKLEGDTGPYLQYVHARARSVLEKVGKPTQRSEILLETDFEKELLVKLGDFNAVVLQAERTYRPSAIATYLFELCRLFNRFYKECPIKTTTGVQRDTRLALVEVTASVLQHGLAVLGIVAPNKM